LFNQAIAAACFALKQMSIYYAHAAPRTLDQSCFLQRTCRARDGGSACPEHLPEELLSQRKGLSTRITVLAHQQPSRQSFDDAVQAIAGSQLRRLHIEKHRETLQLLPQEWAFWEKTEEDADIDAVSRSVAMHHDPYTTALESEDHRETDETLIVDETYVNDSTIGLSRQDRSNTLIQKVA
jgi:hypothetical protein